VAKNPQNQLNKTRTIDKLITNKKDPLKTLKNKKESPQNPILWTEEVAEMLNLMSIFSLFLNNFLENSSEKVEPAKETSEQ
jgi:hypothetical protein